MFFAFSNWFLMLLNSHALSVTLMWFHFNVSLYDIFTILHVFHAYLCKNIIASEIFAVLIRICFSSISWIRVFLLRLSTNSGRCLLRKIKSYFLSISFVRSYEHDFRCPGVISAAR